MKREIEHRTKGKDNLSLMLTIAGVLCAFILLAAMMLVSLAKPPTFAGLDQTKLPLREDWNLNLARYAFYVLIVGFFVSSIGLWINTKRLKRKYDAIRLNLVFLLFVSVIGILVYMIKSATG